MKPVVFVPLWFLILLLPASLDFSYGWFDPIISANGQTPWYSSAGLRSGLIGVFNDELGSTGFHLELHPPLFSPLPIFGGGGPEGGAFGVAAWLPAVLVAIIAIFWRREKRRAVPG